MQFLEFFTCDNRWRGVVIPSGSSEGGDLEEVASWTEVGKSGGGNEGYWLTAPTQRRALVKLPKQVNYREGQFFESEPLSETIASIIGQKLELPVQDAALVKYEGRTAVRLWDFTSPGRELRLGADIAGERPRGTAWQPRVHLRLERVRELLRLVLSDEEVEKYLTWLVCFDILIGNTDRHHENWGVLTNVHGHEIAPFFDNGSGLAAGLDPIRVQRYLDDDQNARFVFDRRFRYEMTIIEGTQPRITELLEVLRVRDGRLGGFIERLEAISDAVIDDVMEEVGNQPLPDDYGKRMEMISVLLRRRRDMFRKES